MSLRPSEPLALAQPTAGSMAPVSRSLAQVLAAGQREAEATAGLMSWGRKAYDKVDKLRKDRAFIGRQNALTNPNHIEAKAAIKKFTPAQIAELEAYYRAIEDQAWTDMAENSADKKQGVKSMMTRRLEIKLRLLEAHLGLAKMAMYNLGNVQKPVMPGGIRAQILEKQKKRDWVREGTETYYETMIRAFIEDVKGELRRMQFA